MSQCTALTTQKTTCKNNTLPNLRFCNIHNPDRPPRRKSLGKIRDALSITDLIKMQSKILKKLSLKSSKPGGLSTKELQSFSAISNSLLRSQKEQLQVTRIDKIEKMLEAQKS